MLEGPAGVSFLDGHYRQSAVGTSGLRIEDQGLLIGSAGQQHLDVGLVETRMGLGHLDLACDSVLRFFLRFRRAMG